MFFIFFFFDSPQFWIMVNFIILTVYNQSIVSFTIIPPSVFTNLDQIGDNYLYFYYNYTRPHYENKQEVPKSSHFCT